MKSIDLMLVLFFMATMVFAISTQKVDCKRFQTNSSCVGSENNCSWCVVGWKKGKCYSPAEQTCCEKGMNGKCIPLICDASDYCGAPESCKPEGIFVILLFTLSFAHVQVLAATLFAATTTPMSLFATARQTLSASRRTNNAAAKMMQVRVTYYLFLSFCLFISLIRHELFMHDRLL
jgi:hypothetical protein